MGSLDVIIRQYEPKDENRIKEICCDTGFLGNPIDTIFSDRELFTDLLVSPYLEYEPDNAFVAEVDGRVVGHLLGSTRKDFDRKMRLVILKTALKMIWRMLDGRYSRHPRTKEYIKWSLTKGLFQRASHPKDAAHSHINIESDYRRQKIGSQLAIAFGKKMREQGITRYYGMGMGTEARLNLDKSLGIEIYSKKVTKKFKPEFPDKTMYHVCTYRFSELPKKYLTVSIHDFTPKYTKELSEIVRELEGRDIFPVNIMLIPNQEEKYNIDDYPGFIKLVKDLRDKGCEIVLHGYNHVSKERKYRSLASFIKGVFFDIHDAEFENIDYQESNEKLANSIEILTNNEIEVAGFVPPGWSVNSESYKAIEDAGFSYMTLRDKLIDFEKGENVSSRALEFTNTFLLADYLSRMFDYYLLHFKLKYVDIIRVPIHPQDLKGSKPFCQALGVIDKLKKEGRTLVTHSQYIESR